MSKLHPVRAEPTTWRDNGHEYPAIRLVSQAKGFLAAVPYDQARRLADQLHDACDQYETQKRLLKETSQ